MKVSLKFNQSAYSGELGDLIYYWDPKLKKMLARRKPKAQKITEHNHRMGAISRNLSNLITNPEFKSDLRVYLDLLMENDLADGANRWFMLYTRMMWKLNGKYPELDIETLSREQIYVHNLSCRSVRTAVEDGLLPLVEGYQRLDELI